MYDPAHDPYEDSCFPFSQELPSSAESPQWFLESRSYLKDRAEYIDAERKHYDDRFGISSRISSHVSCAGPTVTASSALFTTGPLWLIAYALWNILEFIFWFLGFCSSIEEEDDLEDAIPWRKSERHQEPRSYGTFVLLRNDLRSPYPHVRDRARATSKRGYSTVD